MSKQLIRLTATWCQPCKQLAKTINEVEDKLDHLDYKVVDLDEDKTVAVKYNVRSIPTLLILDESGAELGRKTGAISKEDLLQFVQEF